MRWFINSTTSITPPLVKYFYLTLGGSPREILDNIPLVNFIILPIIFIIVFFADSYLKKIKINFSFLKSLILIIAIHLSSNLYHAFYDHQGPQSKIIFFEHFSHYKLLTLNTALRKRGYPPKVKKVSYQIDNEIKNVAYPKDSFSCKVKGKKKIFYLYVDTLRSDMLNSKNMPQTFSRVKNRNFDLFNNYHSLSSSTSTGLFSLFYGLPGFLIHSFTQHRIPPYFYNILKNNNFDLNILGSMHLDGSIFERNVFYGIDIKNKSKGKYDYDKDKSITDLLINYKSNDKNEFHFLFYNCAHNYCYPPNFEEKFKPASAKNYFQMGKNGDPKEFFNRYQNSVLYVDELLSQTLDHIFSKYEKDELYIIISSDHGEAFNELKNNNWGHGNNFSDVQVRTPLAIFHSKAQGEMIDHLVTSEDILPTTLETLFNCKGNIESLSSGKSVYNSENRFPLIFSNYSRIGIREDQNIMEIRKKTKFRYYDSLFNTKGINFQKNGFQKYLELSKKFKK